MSLLRSVLLACSVLTLAFLSSTVFAATKKDSSNPVKLLIVMGGGTYESSVFRFYDTLESINYTLVMSDKEAFASDIRNEFDAVLLYNLSTTIEEPAKTNLKNFVESGKGLVVWHHALASYPNWPWWFEKVVGGQYVLGSNADFPPSTYRQDESMVARATQEHPVVSSLQGHPMHLYDETYQQLRFSNNIKILLKTSLSTSDGPLVWLGPSSDKRVVAIQPGHGSGAYYNVGFRNIMRDAIHWSAKPDFSKFQ